MTRRFVVPAAILVVLIGAAVFAWRTRETPNEREIRGRLDALRNEVNTSTKDGMGVALHAAQIGSYFTDDAIVELGEGAAPIKGRDTIMGMVARLQPRTAAFRMDLDDITIEMVPDSNAADVLLTASFVRRNISTGEESLDAREYAVVMTKADGTWRIARITTIDTLR
ncbi:MAG TPA: nuclear transport factor 2 family protein [Vicinamibacterales bacterium]|nr:nuclear transport factor 2 family protein [Vicinamibacterales bacterium]